VKGEGGGNRREGRGKKGWRGRERDDQTQPMVTDILPLF